MPWREVDKMSLKLEFIRLALSEEANRRELCRRFGISPRTGYKWLNRYNKQGESGLLEKSRRPRNSPNRSSATIEKKVLQVRKKHCACGGRKIKAYLERTGNKGIPSPSTITMILKRNNKIKKEESVKHKPFKRFEMDAPNQLWQMDFKGCFKCTDGQYCHPLSVLDDHSRFLVGLKACLDQKRMTVQGQLTDIFQNYGLPDRMLMDNGSPWGDDRDTPYTIFNVWLIRLGIKISHGRPYHPQTQGKDERLHRTLDDELLSHVSISDLHECQQVFNTWRDSYNYERPHEALGLQPPAVRYHPSPREFPDKLPVIVYPGFDIIRKVDDSGKIYLKNRKFRVGKAFRHNAVGLKATSRDGIFDVYFCSQKISQIDLINKNE